MKNRRFLAAVCLVCAVGAVVLLASLDTQPSPAWRGGEARGSSEIAGNAATAAARTAKAAHRATRRSANGAGRNTPDAHAGALAFAEPREFATRANPSWKAVGYTSDTPTDTHVPVSDSVAVGNFDEDAAGNPDVVQTNVLAGSISVFRGDGRGGFAYPTVIRVGVNPAFVLSGDLNGDKHLDIAIADPGTRDWGNAKSENASVIALLGDGRGGFAVNSTIPMSAPPRQLAFGDVNADGQADIAVALRSPTPAYPFAQTPSAGGVTVLIGGTDDAGALAFSAGQTLTFTKEGAPAGANAVALGDFDGEGGDDLAVAVGTSAKSGDRVPQSREPEGDDLLVFVNTNDDAGDKFAPSPSQRFRVGAFPEGIAVRDFDGDSDTDLVVMCSQSGDVSSFLNDGKGHFTLKATTASVGALPRSLKVADFNGDRVPDLATATFLMSTVSVLEGRGDGSFAPARDFWAGEGPTAVEVGLFDDDKRPDIVAARVRGDALALLTNESRRPDDGVTVARDVPYVAPIDDPSAAHHTLDVWEPPAGTPAFAGRGPRYPVVMFAHGGSGFAGDKTHVALLMRSLARKGIVGISIDYRLDGGPHYADTQTEDYANAFRWARTHVRKFGGDPDEIVIGGTSEGGFVAARLGTFPLYAAEHPHIRGVLLVGAGGCYESDEVAGLTPPPTVALAGDQGGEAPGQVPSDAELCVDAVQARGSYGRFVRVSGRDHFTLTANLARAGDLGRTELLAFLHRVID